MTELAHSRPNKNQWKDAVVVPVGVVTAGDIVVGITDPG
jgi:hypothetical protein